MKVISIAIGILIFWMNAANATALKFSASCAAPFAPDSTGRQIGQAWQVVEPQTGIVSASSPAARELQVTLTQAITPSTVKAFAESGEKVPVLRSIPVAQASSNSITLILGRCLQGDTVTVDLTATP